jgi:hypothetical protein
VTCDIVTSDKRDLPRKNDLTSSASPSAPVPGSDEFSTAKGVFARLRASPNDRVISSRYIVQTTLGHVFWASLDVCMVCMVQASRAVYVWHLRGFNGLVGWEIHPICMTH